MQQSQWKDAEESWVTGVEIAGPAVPGLDKILSAEACAFVAMLERSFGDERRRLLGGSHRIPARIDSGDKPGLPARVQGGPRRRMDHRGHPCRPSPTGGWR